MYCSSDSDSEVSSSSCSSAPAWLSLAMADNTEGKRKESLTLCSGCGLAITDQWLLKVGERWWHAACLTCSACHVVLNSDTSCFLKEDQVKH